MILFLRWNHWHTRRTVAARVLACSASYPRTPQTVAPPFTVRFRSSKMGKSDEDVISQFNEYVNMSASELEKWLSSDESTSAGQAGEGEDGETKGHESGRKIVDILKRNPKKEADKYTDEDIQHMRRVTAYCARHLAQENRLKESKSKEELEQTKSTRSLRNWGHDPLKTM